MCRFEKPCLSAFYILVFIRSRLSLFSMYELLKRPLCFNIFSLQVLQVATIVHFDFALCFMEFLYRLIRKRASSLVVLRCLVE
ncbi:hypothetical protein HanXRQr2_Chr08g0332711 [Helianthus annuus]|uniref:Uncharacterized protein n=1 Tax=Helianthus annuus TaxID=4232 RepID=A0A9K3NCV8_HELAN|nr:hypothetical protein HanXRQr2_Chr08g0332711 [Helianthus annuus]KAJ0901134.1 hypothetical protein HanPSC8_Chr08g0321721 [Helianthus annuus]